MARGGEHENIHKQMSESSGRWEKLSRMSRVRFDRILADCTLFVNWRQKKL